MREWLSWWSATLPRSRPRVRVPSRALFIFLGSVDFTAFPAFFALFALSPFESVKTLTPVIPSLFEAF